jgi:hypothetical protein
MYAYTSWNLFAQIQYGYYWKHKHIVSIGIDDRITSKVPERNLLPWWNRSSYSLSCRQLL